MTEDTSQLNDEEIQRAYELLDIAKEEQRHEIITRLYISRNKDESTFEIGADSVTTPYLENNA